MSTEEKKRGLSGISTSGEAIPETQLIESAICPETSRGVDSLDSSGPSLPHQKGVGSFAFMTVLAQKNFIASV